MNLPRWLAIAVCIIGILFWSQSLWKNDSEPSLFDLPKTLEKETYTITVYSVSNVNGVPVFTTVKSSLEADHLYLVPAPGSAEIPADYNSKKDSGYVLKVHGKFYQGTAIPEAYLYVKPKPGRLRVFQFDSAAMVVNLQNL